MISNKFTVVNPDSRGSKSSVTSTTSETSNPPKKAKQIVKELQNISEESKDVLLTVVRGARKKDTYAIEIGKFESFVSLNEKVKNVLSANYTVGSYTIVGVWRAGKSKKQFQIKSNEDLVKFWQFVKEDWEFEVECSNIKKKNNIKADDSDSGDEKPAKKQKTEISEISAPIGKRSANMYHNIPRVELHRQIRAKHPNLRPEQVSYWAHKLRCGDMIITETVPDEILNLMVRQTPAMQQLSQQQDSFKTMVNMQQMMMMLLMKFIPQQNTLQTQYPDFSQYLDPNSPGNFNIPDKTESDNRDKIMVDIEMSNGQQISMPMPKGSTVGDLAQSMLPPVFQDRNPFEIYDFTADGGSLNVEDELESFSKFNVGNKRKRDDL